MQGQYGYSSCIFMHGGTVMGQLAVHVSMQVRHAGLGHGWYVVWQRLPGNSSDVAALKGPFTSENQARAWMENARTEPAGTTSS